MHVTATVPEYETWEADFHGYDEKRVEYGATSYELFRDSAEPNRFVVLIEFPTEASARAWNEYLEGEGELSEPEMRDVEVRYLDEVERAQLTPA